MIFFTNESSPFCSRSILVSWIAKATGTSVLSMQHGWLQPGLNFESDSKQVGFISPLDNSKCVTAFSKVVTWWGREGLGYPGLTKPLSVRTKIEKTGKNLTFLICTNFNWGVYRKESIFSFFRCIKEISQLFPHSNVLHRPHPAENSKSIFDLLGILPKDLRFERAPSAPVSLRASATDIDVVLSTPSTVALEALAHGIPTFIYSDRTFEEYLKNMKGISFSNNSELSKQLVDLVNLSSYDTPKIEPFNRELFIEIVASECERSSEYTLNESIFLEYIAKNNMLRAK